MPNLREEKKLWKKGYKWVVGLDEVGRGALAGPVVAAAVMIKIPNSKWNPVKDWEGGERVRVQISKLRDSKKLSSKQREKIYKLITRNPIIEWGIGGVSEKIIDKINILEATKLAMKKAIKNLEKKFRKTPSYQNYDRNNTEVEFLILDGKIKLNSPIPQKAIIKADEKVFSCAAASIIAKVWRDRAMQKYHLKYPQYSFSQHKGYPTKFHQAILKKYGPCDIHRNSFKPIRQIKN